MVYFFRFGLFPLLLGYSALAFAEEKHLPGLFVQVDKGHVTVKAKEIPHHQLLQELAKRLGVELFIAGELNEKRSVEFHREPWEEGLKKAIFPAGWAFVYDGAAGRSRLAKVFVLPANKGARVQLPAQSFKVPAQTSVNPAPSASLPKPAPKERSPSIPDEEDELRMLFTELLRGEGGVSEALSEIVELVGDAVEALAEVGGEKIAQPPQQALEDGSEEDVKALLQELKGLIPGAI